MCAGCGAGNDAKMGCGISPSLEDPQKWDPWDPAQSIFSGFTHRNSMDLPIEIVDLPIKNGDFP